MPRQDLIEFEEAFYHVMARGNLSRPISNFATIPSTAAGEIQANKINDSDLFGATPKPSTKPSAGRNNTKPQQPNPTLNRT